MPRYIIKIKDKYFEWGTIVDAPVTYAMTKEELKDYVQQMYGLKGIEDLPERLERVEKWGTSLQTNVKLKELISCNRAGKDESCISEEEILIAYTPKED